MFEPRNPQQPAAGRPQQKHRLGVSTSSGSEVHLLDQLATIYRHRRLVVSVFTVVVTLMMLQSYSTTPLYRAAARVLIDDERTASVRGMDANDPVYWVDPEPYYATQYRILQSPGLAEHTIQQLDLSTAPEFTDAAPTQLGPLEAVAVARATVFGWTRTVAAQVLGFIRPDAVETSGRTEEDQRPARSLATRALATNFAGQIQVSPVGDTRLVDIMYISADPAFAAQAVNAHAETYVRRNLDGRLETVRQTLKWVSGELATQQAAVETSDQALADYRESQDALSLNASTDIVTTRLADLNEQVTRAEADTRQKEVLYHQVADLDPDSGEAEGDPAIAQTPNLVRVTGDLAQLEAQKVTLSSRYGPRHPSIVDINSRIENARHQVRSEVRRAIQTVRSDYETARGAEQRLRLEFDRQKNRAEELSRKEVGYGVLERQSASNQRVYENLLQQEKELQVVANSRTNNVQLIDRAQVPAAPFAPNTRRDWMTAVTLGLMLAVGLVVGVEYLDDTIKTPDDVSRRLHLPLLGVVPLVRGEDRPTISTEMQHDFGEAFRSLRTALVFTSGGSSTRIIGVTSTQPQEGKTTCAANLARVLAIGGARALLIDADMRRPSVHKALDLANSTGLSHVLSGTARIRKAIQRTHDPNLFALTAGHTPSNPSELLASERMRNLITSLETGPFDWVIIDTPPVLAVTDPVILAPLLTGVVIVVGAEMARGAHAARALQVMQAGNGVNVVGVVLNQVDFGRNKYYYSRYYGYQYKSYYQETLAAA